MIYENNTRTLRLVVKGDGYDVCSISHHRVQSNLPLLRQYGSVQALMRTFLSPGLRLSSPTVGAGLIPTRSREGIKPSPTTSRVGGERVQRADVHVHGACRRHTGYRLADRMGSPVLGSMVVIGAGKRGPREKRVG